jgi:PAS domain S-box-containing protein
MSSDQMTAGDTDNLGAGMEQRGSSVFLLDRNYCYTGFNRTHAELMKALYEVKIELGCSLKEAMRVPVDWQIAQAYIDQALQGKTSFDLPVWGAAGPLCHHMVVVCNPIRSDNGAITGVKVFAHDIDAKQHVEEATLQTIHLALESFAATVIVTDIKGDILYANPKFTELTGYTLEEAVGKNLCSLHDAGASSDEYKNLWDRVTSGYSWRGTFHNVKKNGDHYWEYAVISPVFNKAGKIIRFVAVKEDITQQMQEDQTLRESEEKLRQILGRLPFPILVAKQNRVVSFINERFKQTFGYEQAELPTLEAWEHLAYPNDNYLQQVRKARKAAHERAKREQSDVDLGELDITCSNGNVRIVEASIVIINDYLIAAYTDITERRHNERLIKASYERKRKTELFNELIRTKQPSKHTVAACARLMGMCIMEPFSCYLWVMNSFKGMSREYCLERREIYQTLADSLVDILTDDSTIAWETGEGIGVICFRRILAGDVKAIQIAWAEKMLKTITDNLPNINISVGISEHGTNLSEIGKYFRQASNSIHSSRQMRPLRRIYHYQDIGVLQILPYFDDQQQIKAYIERNLGKLLRYDKKVKDDFLATLEVILVSDNLKEAADILSIHYKTLMYRKQRLEEILGISLDSFVSRMAVATAVTLMKLNLAKSE